MGVLDEGLVDTIPHYRLLHKDERRLAVHFHDKVSTAQLAHRLGDALDDGFVTQSLALGEMGHHPLGPPVSSY